MDVRKPEWMPQEQFDALEADEVLMVNELTSLEKQNEKALVSLIQGGAIPPPEMLQAMMVDLRFECILSQLFPDLGERLKFEIYNAQREAEFWARMHNEAVKAKLALGGGGGLITPNGTSN